MEESRGIGEGRRKKEEEKKLTVSNQMFVMVQDVMVHFVMAHFNKFFSVNLCSTEYEFIGNGNICPRY